MPDAADVHFFSGDFTTITGMLSLILRSLVCNFHLLIFTRALFSFTNIYSNFIVYFCYRADLNCKVVQSEYWQPEKTCIFPQNNG